MKHSAKHSRGWLIFGAAILLYCAWAIYQGLNCEPTKCNSSPSFSQCYGEAFIWLPFALWMVLRPLWNIHWDETHVYYRTKLGRRIKAPLDEITDFEYCHMVNDGHLEFENHPRYYIGLYLDNIDALLDQLKTHLDRKKCTLD